MARREPVGLRIMNRLDPLQRARPICQDQAAAWKRSLPSPSPLQSPNLSPRRRGGDPLRRASDRHRSTAPLGTSVHASHHRPVPALPQLGGMPGEFRFDVRSVRSS
jgi:hypothetical protein